jgi:hypothetical protein
MFLSYRIAGSFAAKYNIMCKISLSDNAFLVLMGIYVPAYLVHLCSQSTVIQMYVITSIPMIISYANSLREVLSCMWACHVTIFIVLISGKLKSKRDYKLVVELPTSVF